MEISPILCYNVQGDPKQEGEHRMRIAIVDDQPICREELQTSLQSALDSLGIASYKIDAFSSSKEFISSWHSGGYDVVFLDIYMDEENGISLARRIRQTDEDVVLIFCTSGNEFAAESYEVRASYYLTKPVSTEKLTVMFQRINLLSLERDRSVCLPDGFRCLLRQIIYTEYLNHTIIFHLGGGKPHTVYMNQYDAEALLLTDERFRSVNKGCIVNFAMVKRMDGSVLTMQNGDKIPISRRRYKEISEAYTKYRFDKLSKAVDC